MFKTIGEKFIRNTEHDLEKAKKHLGLTGFIVTLMTVGTVIKGISLIKDIEDETHVLSNGLRKIHIGKTKTSEPETLPETFVEFASDSV